MTPDPDVEEANSAIVAVRVDLCLIEDRKSLSIKSNGYLTYPAKRNTVAPHKTQSQPNACRSFRDPKRDAADEESGRSVSSPALLP
jgi:hypothetical protein